MQFNEKNEEIWRRKFNKKKSSNTTFTDKKNRSLVELGTNNTFQKFHIIQTNTFFTSNKTGADLQLIAQQHHQRQNDRTKIVSLNIRETVELYREERKNEGKNRKIAKVDGLGIQF